MSGIRRSALDESYFQPVFPIVPGPASCLSTTHRLCLVLDSPLAGRRTVRRSGIRVLPMVRRFAHHGTCESEHWNMDRSDAGAGRSSNRVDPETSDEHHPVRTCIPTVRPAGPSEAPQPRAGRAAAGHRPLSDAVSTQPNILSSPHLCSLPGIGSPGAAFSACAHTPFASSVSSMRSSLQER
jgi:hypothetical protein